MQPMKQHPVSIAYAVASIFWQVLARMGCSGAIILSTTQKQPYSRQGLQHVCDAGKHTVGGACQW